jgi:DNA-binding CsgD family transcriptional regulator
MSRKRYHPDLFVAASRGGLSNRRIADLLGIDEATVRRGLKKVMLVTEPRTVRLVLAELADLLDEQH